MVKISHSANQSAKYVMTCILTCLLPQRWQKKSSTGSVGLTVTQVDLYFSDLPDVHVYPHQLINFNVHVQHFIPRTSHMCIFYFVDSYQKLVYLASCPNSENSSIRMGTTTNNVLIWKNDLQILNLTLSLHTTHWNVVYINN